MKTKFIVAAIIFSVGAVACSKDDGNDKAKDLYTVVSEAARSGYAWVATNDFLVKDGGEIELNGKNYHDLASIIKDLRADGYVADTSLSLGKLDTENKKFGCAWLGTQVYNFSAHTTSVVSAGYYLDECACLNSKRSYSQYDDVRLVAGNDTLIVIAPDKVVVNVTEHSNNHFIGEFVYYTADQKVDYTEKLKLEPILKSELISNGLTQIDSFKN